MQTPVFKDIDELSQKATIAGTEKLPVSDTEYITPDQIADLAPSQKQSDWNESDQDDPAYIKNKPSIPAAQVNSDWNAVSGVAEILNKPSIPDVSGKADKVSSPTSGHFAGLDGNGNLIDSGSKASDFATASQGGKADTAYQKPSGGIPASDMASGVIPDVSGKQDTLVSGTNIKTVNNESILGSGNISVGEPNAVKYVEQTLTEEQKAQARTNIGSGTFSGNPVIGFSTPSTPDGTIIAEKANGDTETIDLNHNHPAYYSKEAETSNPSGGFLPDVVYSLGTLTGTVTFSLAAAVTGNVNHYFWMFDTGSTAPTVTFPASVTKWTGNCVTSNAPVISANKRYEVSVLDGVGFIFES